MDFSVLVKTIIDLGFPVAVCLIMMYYIKYDSDKNREQLSKIMELHREETNGLQQAVNNNTLVVTRLCAKLGVDDVEMAG